MTLLAPSSCRNAPRSDAVNRPRTTRPSDGLQRICAGLGSSGIRAGTDPRTHFVPSRVEHMAIPARDSHRYRMVSPPETSELTAWLSTVTPPSTICGVVNGECVVGWIRQEGRVAGRMDEPADA